MTPIWKLFIAEKWVASVVPSQRGGWDWALLSGAKQGRSWFRWYAIGRAEGAAKREAAEKPPVIIVEEPEPEPPVIIPAAGDWPNAPRDWPVLVEQPFDLILGNNISGPGQVEYNTAETRNGPNARWSGLLSVVNDATAPLSPPRVAEFRYPQGFVPGEAPATLTFPFPRPVRQLYVGFWVKTSDPWHPHTDSGVNKLCYLWGPQKSMYLEFHDNGSHYELRVHPQFSQSDDRDLRPNVAASPYRLGIYQRIELAIDLTGEASELRWWLNEKHVGYHWGVWFPPEGLTAFQLSPTFGGDGGEPKRSTDYHRYDHVIVRGR